MCTTIEDVDMEDIHSAFWVMTGNENVTNSIFDYRINCGGWAQEPFLSSSLLFDLKSNAYCSTLSQNLLYTVQYLLVKACRPGNAGKHSMSRQDPPMTIPIVVRKRLPMKVSITMQQTMQQTLPGRRRQARRRLRSTPEGEAHHAPDKQRQQV